MAGQFQGPQATALQAGAYAGINFFEGTLAFDFSLQNVRHAYIAGASTYLQAMSDANLQAAISRREFENVLGVVLPEFARTSDNVPTRIKVNLLLASIRADRAIYDHHWEQQYRARGLQNPNVGQNLAAASASAASNQVTTKATFEETKAALVGYYRSVCADAALPIQTFAESTAEVQETVECIKRWTDFATAADEDDNVVVVVEEEEEDVEMEQGGDDDDNDDDGDDDDDDEDDEDEDDEDEDDEDEDDDDDEDDGGAAQPAQPANWEQRQNGLYYCLLCRRHSGIVHKSSLNRHLRLTHGVDPNP